MADPHKVDPLQKGPKGWKAKLNGWAKSLEWCIAEIKKLRRRRGFGGRTVTAVVCDKSVTPPVTSVETVYVE